MMTTFRIALYNLRSIPGRWGNSLATVIGVSAVVGVLASTMMMTSALKTTIDATSRADWAILVRQGAVVESMSTIPRDRFEIIQGIYHKSDYEFYPQFVTNIVRTRSANNDISSSVLIRGLSPRDTVLTTDMQIVDGRSFASGQHELIVGRLASMAFDGLTIGTRLTINGVEWEIVGQFDSKGLAASELRGDLVTLMSSSASSSYSSIRVKLTAPVTVADLNTAIKADRRLALQALPESEFFKSNTSATLFEFVAYTVSTIMGIGATFAAISVMFTSIDTRTLEIATLRTLGFPARVITASVLAESILLACVGGTIGLLSCYILFHGSTYTSGSMSSIVTPLALSWEVASIAMTWAGLVGVAAGVFPAIRANRIPIVQGLRIDG